MHKGGNQWELVFSKAFQDSSQNMDLLGAAATWMKTCLIQRVHFRRQSIKLNVVGQLLQVSIHVHPCHPLQLTPGNSFNVLIKP